MWGEALDLLDRADRLHRQFFRLAHHRNRCPTWEPPVDIFEREQEFAIFVVLPGVAAEQLEVCIEGSAIVVRGQRAMPAACNEATIQRLEIPYGRFERRIEFPLKQFRITQQSLQDGCLSLTLLKLG